MRVVFKAVIVILILVALTITFGLWCQFRQKEICSSRVEDHLRAELARILKLFMTTQQKMEDKKYRDARLALLEAFHTMQTLHNIFPITFLDQNLDTEFYKEHEEKVIKYLRPLLAEDTSSLSKFAWKDFQLLLQILDGKLGEEERSLGLKQQNLLSYIDSLSRTVPSVPTLVQREDRSNLLRYNHFAITQEES